MALVAVENRGTVEAPALHGLVFGGPVAAPPLEQIVRTMRRLLGLDVDLTPFYAHAAQDPRLRTATVALRGLKPPHFATLCETIANVVPFQQVSIAAGVAVVARLVERFGQRLACGTRTYMAFPGLDQVAGADVDDLHGLGLSQAKARTLLTLAGQVASGALSEARLEALSSVEAMTRLTARPGIGPWSAGLILLRGPRRLIALIDDRPGDWRVCYHSARGSADVWAHSWCPVPGARCPVPAASPCLLVDLLAVHTARRSPYNGTRWGRGGRLWG